MVFKVTSTPEERFVKFFDKSAQGCWNWRGAKQNAGYGVFHPTKKNRMLAHRFSWEMNNGPIPAGLFVCHHCDNRLCVRPDHLFLGTIQDNHADMMRKGRQINGPNNPYTPKTHCIHGHALTDDNVYTSTANGKTWRACKTCVFARSRRRMAEDRERHNEYCRRSREKRRLAGAAR